MASKTVVIIGASFAGASIAQGLLKDKDVSSIKVVLINPSPTFYFNIAAPRILTKSKAFRPEQYLIPIASAFSQYPTDSFEFVQGTATAIDTTAKSVTVDEDRVISYDYLAIASGSTTPSTTLTEGVAFPFKPSGEDNMQTLIQASQKAIAGAKSIVIAGAGPIGVEVAGEIADVVQESGSAITITLVSAADQVLPMLKPSSSDAARQMLKDKKVTLVTGSKVTGAIFSSDSNTWVVSLENGEHLTADVYIPTTGVLPNNSFIPAELLDGDGWVKVDKELRVKDVTNVYAAGDITNNSMRLSFKAREQAHVATANLKADILGKGKRQSFDQGTSIMMAVPIGASGGTGQMFGMTIWSFLVKMLKGKDFFISKARTAVETA